MINTLLLHEQQDLLSDMMIESYKAYSEGFLSLAAKGAGAVAKTTAKTAVKAGKEVAKTAWNIPVIVNKILKMISNLLKVIYNGEKMIKELLNALEKLEKSPRVPNAKINKTMDLVTVTDIKKMGFDFDRADNNKTDLTKNGSEAELFMGIVMDLISMSEDQFEKTHKAAGKQFVLHMKDEEDFKKQVLVLAEIYGLKNNGWNDQGLNGVSPDQLGKAIREEYTTNKKKSSTSERSMSKKENTDVGSNIGKYFKKPFTTKVENKNGSAANEVAKTLEYVKELATSFSKVNLSEMLKEIEKGIKTTAAEAESFRQKYLVKEGAKGNAESFDILDNDYFLLKEIASYGESFLTNPSDNQNNDTDNQFEKSTENNQNNKEEDIKEDESEDANDEVKTDVVGKYYPYIEAYLKNRAISINKLANNYNAFLVNLSKIGYLAIANFKAVTVAKKGE